MKTNPPTPHKTYGKQAFTPEVPPQVLHNGHLVDADNEGRPLHLRPCMSSLMHDTTLPPQF